MSTLRKTSLYVLSVPNAEGLLDAMIDIADADMGIERAGAWLRNGDAVLMFRAAGDQVAIAAAEGLGGDTPGSTLHTGIGVNRRIVATA